MTPKKVYTADEIDALCWTFNEKVIELEKAKKEHTTAKADLLAVVQAQGHIAPRADKTTRLQGAIYVADSTVGSTINVDERAVGELQLELSRMKKAAIFRLLFNRQVSHALIKGAGEVLKLKIGGMRGEVQARLLALFACCFKVDTKAPTLTVQLVSVLEAKEKAAAEKAQSKATKRKK